MHSTSKFVFMHTPTSSDKPADFFFSVIQQPGITDAEYHAAWLNFIDGDSFDETKARRDLIAARNVPANLVILDHDPIQSAAAIRIAA
jgi:hypothetical protein